MMEDSLATTLIIFVCVFGALLVGLFASRYWPSTHLDERSKDVVKLGIGIVVTMTVLILSLMVSSVKGSFDTTDRDLRQFATSIIVLDRSISHYGSDAQPARLALRQYTVSAIHDLWPTGADPNIRIEGARSGKLLDQVETDLRALKPTDDAHRSYLSEVLAQYDAVIQARWIFIDDSSGSVLRPFFFVVVAWLMVIFATIGLYSPRNATVVLVMALSILSLSGATYLMSEMETPFSGVIVISSYPLRNALAQQMR
ncbi:hypothetical protein [Acidisoma sp. S159]|uniref:bestrophin-like domain n=1 Tax=Acidisoma sp. S159 TaxID=1747225 RepID=UPI00131D5169|nr:hypothetical protein [Acidisoma sp. S159]